MDSFVSNVDAMLAGKTFERVNFGALAVRFLVVAACCCVLGLLAFSMRGVNDAPIAQRLIWEKTSANGAFVVTLDAQATMVPLRQFQEWTVEVRDSNGDPVHPARFAIGGGMPGHGHGLPSQPRVTQHLSAGKYLISGLKFNMAGDWLLLVDIESQKAIDRVSFEFKIEY